MNNKDNLVLHILLLVFLCGTLYFPYLSATSFFDKGEPREALAVQDIVQRGEWLFPLKRATEIPSKPPLFHWSAALTSRITGKMSEATVRFPSAFYASLGVLFLYLFGRKLFSAQVALLGAAITASTWIYSNQALSARVDMTLSFFITTSLVLFYSLYCGWLSHSGWYYAFYTVIGIGTLAKGPLGFLLPGLVAATFLVVKKRWDFLIRLCLHPGAVLTIILAVGWYGIALARIGEAFVQRQIVQENLNGFFGGSGHTHPGYYYLPYLFSNGLLWSLFLPFFLWDSFKRDFFVDNNRLFLALWCLVILLFFSIAREKRAVYLLPLYPALSLLLATWFYEHGTASCRRRLLYRSLSIVAGCTAVLLLIIIVGTAWNHEPSWFFAPIETFLKPKDRANVALIRNQLGALRSTFTFVSLLSAILWLWFAHDLWTSNMRGAASRLIVISIALAFITRVVVVPVIDGAKSYRPFMQQVNERVRAGDKLYLYGRSFNGDPVIFYRGGPIESIEQPEEILAAKIGRGDAYLIMAEKTWIKLQKLNPDLPVPLLKSSGTGPEADARIVLIAGTVCKSHDDLW